MSEQQQQLQSEQQQNHGRHFLSDANSKEPSLSSAVGRPILGSGGGAGGVVPDVSAHEWNVNVADFVPTLPAAPTAASGDNPAAQMAAQMLGRLRSASDREQVETIKANGLSQLRKWARTRDDVDHLVRSLVRLASAEQNLCEPAAALLAHLALHFTVSEKESPQLLDRPGSLAHLPVYAALMKHCSAENDTLRRQLAAQKTATEDQASYALLFCLLYACLMSPTSPNERQPSLARAALQLLSQMAGLSNCPAGFRAVHLALLRIGEFLDADCLSSAGAVNGGDGEELSPARQLEDVYERLRQAVAHCLVGDVGLATDIIRLLELRASNWGRPPSGYAASPSVSNTSQSMTDDMYADYEQFLRESGQL